MFKKILITLLLSLSLCSDVAVAKPRIVELTGQNTIIFAGVVDPVSTNTFVRALIGIRNELPMNQTLYVILASQGGSYEHGKTLLEFMDRLPNTQLICRYCASAAGMMFIASKHKRLVNEGSNLLMHEMYLPKVTALNAMDNKTITHLISSSEDFNKMHYSRIGITREAYMKKIKDKVWNVWGADIIKIHLADELVTLKCDEYIKMLAPKTCDPKKDDDANGDGDGRRR